MTRPQQCQIVLIGSMMLSALPVRFASASDFIYGYWSRPACGKVCKLVCDRETLVSTCYACECNDICIPPPSRPGCKHCATCCASDPTGTDGACCPRACRARGPECEFCWRDWFASGCAPPRTVKVLTKYQAEKEICWYHWEVVDAAKCDAAGGEEAIEDGGGTAAQDSIYKPAPANAELGARLPLSENERIQLSSYFAKEAGTENNGSSVNPTTEAAGDSMSEPAGRSIWQRIARQLVSGD